MKKHLIKIWYSLPDGKNYIIQGLVNEVLGDNNKPIVYANSIFKQAFGFQLPNHSRITFI